MQPTVQNPSAATRRFAAAAAIGAAMVLATATSAAAPTPAATPDVQRLMKDGQYTQALKAIDEALARNPGDAQMRFRRGVALSMLDRKAEALAVFQKLTEDYPDMPAPYNNMAVIYGSQGEYDKARGALERAIRTNPAYATAYQNLGDVYAQLASQAYSKALQLDKNDGSVQPKLALLRELTAGSGSMSTAPTPSNDATQTVAVTASPTAPRTMTIAAAPTPPAVTAKAPPAPSTPPAPTPAPSPAPASASAPAVKASAAAIVVAKASAPAAKSSVSASAPTVTAAAKPASAASVIAATPTTPPRATTGGANPLAEVDAAVKAWVAAWSKRDMEGYFAAYTPGYTGQSSSRKAWEQERRDRIASRKRIQVELSEVRISVNGDKAEARFRQSYESDTLSVISRKTLYLTRSPSGAWLIQRESVGN